MFIDKNCWFGHHQKDGNEKAKLTKKKAKHFFLGWFLILCFKNNNKLRTRKWGVEIKQESKKEKKEKENYLNYDLNEYQTSKHLTSL